MMQQQPVVIGTFGAPHGLQGWLKVHAATENRQGILEYQPWLTQRDGQWSSVVLASWKQTSDQLLVKLTTIHDRNAAQCLVNQPIAIEATQLPPLAEAEYYWCQLVACQVVTTTGYALGQVTHLLETGANDVLVVKAAVEDAYGMSERLIPWIVPTVVQQVDLAGRQLTVDWDPAF